MVTEPAIVTKLRGKDITSIACGQNHSMFLSSSGHVYACGNGYYGQLGLDQEIDYVGVRRKKHLVYASRSDVASSARHHASRLRRDLHALRREQQRTHRQRVAGDERRRVRRQPTQVPFDEPILKVAAGTRFALVRMEDLDHPQILSSASKKPYDTHVYLWRADETHPEIPSVLPVH